MATATETKPREVTYFEMRGTSQGTDMRLTKPSMKAIEHAQDVFDALSKAGSIFPKAAELREALAEFLNNPTAPGKCKGPPNQKPNE